MIKNKGIIGIGLILAIVLGIVIVGGGAYYFGKNSNNIKKYTGPENTGICGQNGEFCPGTPGYEERIKREKQNIPVVDSQNSNTINSVTETSTISKNGITVTIPKSGFTYDTNVAHVAGNSAVALNIIYNDKIIISIYKWNNESLFAESIPSSGSYKSVDMNYSINGIPAQYYKLLYRGVSAIIVPSKLTQIQVDSAEFIGITQSIFDQIIASIKIN